MKMNRQKLFQQSLAMVLLLVMLVVSACGGSTRGTGGITIDGKVLNRSSEAASDVRVTILETGDSSVTDAEGVFRITIVDRLSSVSLLFEKGALSAQSSIEDIPENAERLRATFEVDEEENSATTGDVEIEVRRDDSGNDRNPAGEDDDTGPGDESDSGMDDSDDSDDDSVDDSSSPEDSEEDSDGDDSDDSRDDSEEDDDDRDDESGEDHSGPGGGDIDDDDFDDDLDDDLGGDDDREENPEMSCDDIDVEGNISAINASSLTVSGVTYVVTSDTEIENEDGDDINLNELKVGDRVRVQGRCENGVLEAKDIRIED